MMMKKIALAASLALVAFGASAMNQVADEELSSVSGQDGVSIFADLNVNIGSFQWSNKDAGGTSHSIGFNNIAITGAFAMSLDVVSGGVALQDAMGHLGLTSVDQSFLGAGFALSTTTPGTLTAVPTDAIQISFPTSTWAANGAKGMSIAVGSIAMGNAAGTSLGSLAINNLDLGGTKVWIWGH